jgi:DNA-binding CsgD family transcriptional regulator
MISQDTVVSLVSSAYECAVDASQWVTFLERLADTLHCATTQIASHDFGKAAGGISAAFRMNPHFVRQYDEYFNRVNIFFKRPSHVARLGRVYTGQMLCNDAVLERSEYYNDFFRQFDVFHALGGTLRQSDTGIAVVSCLRSKRAGQYSKEEGRALQYLVPHLQRVLQIDRFLRETDDAASSLENVLNWLSVGCVLLERSGRCVFMNDAARRLASANDGFTTSDGSVCSSTNAQTQSLCTLIERAFRVLEHQALEGGGALRLSRPSGKRPLEVLVTPFHTATFDTWNQPLVAIFLRDPETALTSNTQLLQRQYSLTTTEAEIAEALIRGRSLSEIAESRHCLMSTVRWHIKRVFAKTGLRTQSELVRQLSRGSIE